MTIHPEVVAPSVVRGSENYRQRRVLSLYLRAARFGLTVSPGTYTSL